MKFLYFFFLNLILIILLSYFYLFFGSVIFMYMWNAAAYITVFFPFFIKYFIPIYFLLSLYSINYKGYYYLKFFGFEANLVLIHLNNIFVRLKNLIYNYKFSIIFIFFITLSLSFFYEKIYSMALFFSS